MGATNSKQEPQFQDNFSLATAPPMSLLLSTNLENISDNMEYTLEQVPDKDMYFHLRSMFPHIEQNVLKKLLIHPPFSIDVCSKSELLERFANYCIELSATVSPKNYNLDYLKSNADLDYVCEKLKNIFPNVDASYIYSFASKNYQDIEAIHKFIDDNLKNPKYPVDENCLERVELRKTYIENFDVKKFVDVFSDPVEYFEDPKRKCEYNYNALEYLRKVYIDHKVNHLHNIFKEMNFNLTLTIQKLDNISLVKSRRQKYELDNLLNTNNIDLLLEVVFLKNKDRILRYMKLKDEQEFKEIKKCIRRKSFIECQCCMTDYIPSRLMACNAQHVFCKACLIKSIEVKISDGNYTLNCILNCGSQFKISDIQKILKPADFRKFIKKWQEAEVQKAQIDGLVSCPFCHFSMIVPKDDKIFHCMNPECKKVSCRLCKQINHAPDPCAAKVKACHRLEEEMTKALLRNCYQCGKSYFKVEGCNFITCVCGAKMCYICDKKITDYSHFGSCKQDSNSVAENQERVRNAARNTVREILRKYPDMKTETDKLMK